MNTRLVMTLVVLSCDLGAVIGGSELAKEDGRRLQGTWQAVKAQADGKEAEQAVVKSVQFSFKGDTITFHGGASQNSARFTLDAATNPRRINTEVLDGKAQGEMRLGIYELSGDSLRLCWSKSVSRPTGFITNVGDKWINLELKRVMPAAAQDKPAGETSTRVVPQAQDRRVVPRGPYVVYKVDITDFSENSDIPIANYWLRKDAEKYAAYRRNQEKSSQHWNYTVVKVLDDEKNTPPDSDSPPPSRRVPTKAIPADDLVNSTGKGSETLQGYGALSFTFNGNNEVIMHDTAGTSTGRWQRVGNQLTLHFFDGKVVYAGTVRDDQIGGTASNGKTAWNWSVQIQMRDLDKAIALDNAAANANAAYVARRNGILARTNQLLTRASQQGDPEVLRILQKLERLILLQTPSRLERHHDLAILTAILNSADRTLNKSKQLLE